MWSFCGWLPSWLSPMFAKNLQEESLQTQLCMVGQGKATDLLLAPRPNDPPFLCWTPWGPSIKSINMFKIVQVWCWWSSSLARFTTKRNIHPNDQINLCLQTHFSYNRSRKNKPFHRCNPRSVEGKKSLILPSDHPRPIASSKACIIPISPTFAHTWRGKQRWFGGNPFLRVRFRVQNSAQPNQPRKTVTYLLASNPNITSKVWCVDLLNCSIRADRL